MLGDALSVTVVVPTIGRPSLGVLLDALATATGLGIKMFERVGRSNGQLTDMMVAYLGNHKLPEAMRKNEALQAFLRTQMHNAEKDLACALDLARETGVSLPGAALVSQLMARIYAIDDTKRR